jgi:hypothetical protein
MELQVGYAESKIRRFSREFKIEVVKLVGKRGVSVGQAGRAITRGHGFGLSLDSFASRAPAVTVTSPPKNRMLVEHFFSNRCRLNRAKKHLGGL